MKHEPQCEQTLPIAKQFRLLPSERRLLASVKRGRLTDRRRRNLAGPDGHNREIGCDGHDALQDTVLLDLVHGHDALQDTVLLDLVLRIPIEEIRRLEIELDARKENDIQPVDEAIRRAVKLRIASERESIATGKPDSALALTTGDDDWLDSYELSRRIKPAISPGAIRKKARTQGWHKIERGRRAMYWLPDVAATFGQFLRPDASQAGDPRQVEWLSGAEISAACTPIMDRKNVWQLARRFGWRQQMVAQKIFYLARDVAWDLGRRFTMPTPAQPIDYCI